MKNVDDLPHAPHTCDSRLTGTVSEWHSSVWQACDLRVTGVTMCQSRAVILTNVRNVLRRRFRRYADILCALHKECPRRGLESKMFVVLDSSVSPLLSLSSAFTSFYVPGISEMSTNPVLFAFRSKCLQQILRLFRTFLHQISNVIKVCTTTCGERIWIKHATFSFNKDIE